MRGSTAGSWSGLAVVCALLVAGCGAGEGRGREYHPDPRVLRLGGDASFAIDELDSVEDFDLDGDRLYLLERFGRVVVLQDEGGSWRVERSFGRSGAGPGEFRTASGIAVTEEGVVVVEHERLHVFDRDGVLLRTEALRLPCPMMRPSVSAGTAGVLVHGNCFRFALATDTMKAVVAWSPAARGDGPFRVLAEEVRFTRDGTVGTIFGAPRALTTGADGEHLFGTGIANCVWRLTERQGEAARHCPVVAELYSAPPSEEVRRRLQAGIPGLRVAWPKTLPAYVDRLRVGDTLVLVRPFAADSIVFQTAAPDARDIAVAEFRGFVGCRAGGCLWSDDRGAVSRLTLLDAAALRSLLVADRDS